MGGAPLYGHPVIRADACSCYLPDTVFHNRRGFGWKCWMENRHLCTRSDPIRHRMVMAYA